jgi:hypothetical protein
MQYILPKVLGDVAPFNPKSNPVPQPVVNTSSNFLTTHLIAATSKYAAATILIELPILLLLGLRSKRAAIWIVIVNIISVFSYHFIAAYLLNHGSGPDLSTGAGMIWAEVNVTAFEAIVLAIVLRKSFGIWRIILSVVAANAASAILGGVVFNNILGGF